MPRRGQAGGTRANNFAEPMKYQFSLIPLLTHPQSSNQQRIKITPLPPSQHSKIEEKLFQQSLSLTCEKS
jgi:hypothetical protein